MDALIPRLVSRIATPLILALALYLFLRGHNNPGGGFIAGLVAASAIVLQAVVWSREEAGRYVPVPGWLFIGLGLLFAAGTGIGGILLGYPFLTHAFGPVHLGRFEVELATAQLFDLGVFLVVVGTTQSVILNISGDPVIRPEAPAGPMGNGAGAGVSVEDGGKRGVDRAPAAADGGVAPPAGEETGAIRHEGEGSRPWSS
ncbi:MnhB domain-containing protein [Limnochorda pilosa]|uniref:Cation:proton antiporter n=1 Tax=Limnochorda pilosa TaxID=1555112 RepID=A0A0K2SKQ0_LIMPI|nr:MnhB domain-containing protein [Limnochorda pilosa]BAS27681.1 cation:proton antiporter [Limnochorda pilosa]